MPKPKTAILRSSTPAIITLCEVTIAKYDAILDQSEYMHLDNHLSNDTDLNCQGKYFIVRDCSLEAEAITWHLKKSSSSDDMQWWFFF